MDLSYSAGQERLRRALRNYYRQLLDSDTVQQLRAEPTGPIMRSVVKQMATDGWLGIGWPVEWGGQGQGPIEQFIFYDESTRAGAPVPVIGINTVGPALMAHGTPEQKRAFLPRIVGGEAFFCIGYSEPETGTDLAGLSSTAVRDGDDYVINGQKMWTRFAPSAEYCWLAVRTDPALKRHRGISILIVPMDSPGITVTPLRLLDEHEIGAVSFDEVRVPHDQLIGGANNGWAVVTSQLNQERATVGASGQSARMLDEVRHWAQTTVLSDGRRVIDQAWVQAHLARAHARLDVLRLMNWHIACRAREDTVSVADVSAVKVFSSEFNLEVSQLLFEIVGEPGYLRHGSVGMVLESKLEELYRYQLTMTFGGGANEIQRELIAAFGLGLPRPRH